MLFRKAILDRMVNGEVDLAFRRWRRAPPAEGATLRTAVGVVALEDVRVIEEADITDADARRSGAGSRGALLAELATEGTLYRMTVRIVGADPRGALRTRRLDAGGASDLSRTLDAIDGRAARSWTRELLRAVHARPGTPARELAALVGMEAMELKRRMRRLKELGLTESLDVGYRLSPRGRDLVKVR